MLLEVTGLKSSYGHTQALFGVDLAIAEGEVVALMGRNGMGKTTTIASIIGLLTPTSGTVRFNGKDIAGLPSHKAAQAGLGLVPEGRRCFPNLTVEENLNIAARGKGWTQELVCGLFPRLGERLGQSAATLSGGEQQMLAIGRALMTNPRLLILDEATEGLAPLIRQDIWRSLRELKNDGQSILVVDKTLSEILAIADRIYILEKGVVVWSGRSSELEPAVQDRYLGV